MYATVIVHMGISQGLHTMRALEEMDATRVKSADRKASEGARQARKRRRRVRKGLEDEIVQVEGQVYGAGIADWRTTLERKAWIICSFFPDFAPFGGDSGTWGAL